MFTCEHILFIVRALMANYRRTVIKWTRNRTSQYHSSSNLSLVESPFHNTSTLTSTRGCWLFLLFCLSPLPPACCLNEIYDECSRRVVLAAVSTLFLCHPSARSVFPFHSPSLLLLSHTSPLPSCVQPTCLLLSGFLLSLFFLVFFFFWTSFQFLSRPT